MTASLNFVPPELHVIKQVPGISSIVAVFWKSLLFNSSKGSKQILWPSLRGINLLSILSNEIKASDKVTSSPSTKIGNLKSLCCSIKYLIFSLMIMFSSMFSIKASFSENVILTAFKTKGAYK